MNSDVNLLSTKDVMKPYASKGGSDTIATCGGIIGQGIKFSEPRVYPSEEVFTSSFAHAEWTTCGTPKKRAHKRNVKLIKRRRKLK